MTRAEFFMQMLDLYFYHVLLGSSTHSEVLKIKRGQLTLNTLVKLTCLAV